MPNRTRVLWGCFGAIVAVMTSFLSVDLANFKEHWAQIDGLAVFYYSLKYVITLFVGGLLAYLKATEKDKLNLLAIGASAPTVLVTLFSTQTP
jgi:hypothetical protein